MAYKQDIIAMSEARAWKPGWDYRSGIHQKLGTLMDK
jgi:hypothetical protein